MENRLAGNRPVGNRPVGNGPRAKGSVVFRIRPEPRHLVVAAGGADRPPLRVLRHLARERPGVLDLFGAAGKDVEWRESVFGEVGVGRRDLDAVH